MEDWEGLRDLAEKHFGLAILGDKGYTREVLLRVLAKSFRGLCTRLQNKKPGHNLCMAFNSIFQEPCYIGKIKQLVF